MISAGKTYGIKGLAKVRRDDPRLQKKPNETLEQYQKRLKSIGVEAHNKGHNAAITKYAKQLKDSGSTDTFYKCPYINAKRETLDYGAICKAAKINTLLAETTDERIKLLVTKGQLDEVTREEFLSDLQRKYLFDYTEHFVQNPNVENLLKVPENESAQDRNKRLDAIWEQLKKFLQGHLGTPDKKGDRQSYIDKNYAFVNGKIYKKKKHVETKYAKAGTKIVPENQCFDRSKDSVTVIQDCTCAVGDGDVECSRLDEDLFPKSRHKVPDGKIRAKLYFNVSTKELRLIEDKERAAVPPGFAPLAMTMGYPKSRAQIEALKWVLSRHTDAKKDPKNGGKKILFDFLKLDKKTAIFNDETNPNGIYRNGKGHFVVDMDRIRYMTNYNMHLGKSEHRGIVKKGIRATPEEMATLIKFINSHPKLSNNRHEDTVRIDNFALKNKKVKDDGTVTYECLLPGDQLFLEKLEKVLKSKYVQIMTLVTKKAGRSWYPPWRKMYKIVRRGTGKYKSLIPGVQADTLKTLLERIGDHWLAAHKRGKESLELQKKNYKEGKIARLKQAAMWVKQIVINVITSATFQILGLLGMAMLWFKPVRDKIFGFVREKTYPVRSPLYRAKRAVLWNKYMRRIRKFYGVRRIPFIGISDKKEARFDAKGNKLAQEGINIKKAEEARLVESEHPEWKLKLLKISQGQDAKAEIGFEWMEKMRDKLVRNPDRIIIGMEKEAWLYIDALNEREMGHPTPYGPSGAGKFQLAKTAAQLVAMDDLWHNKRDALVAAVQNLYADEKDSTKVQALLDKYREVSEHMRDRYPNVTGMQFFRLDKSKMGGSTDGIVGSFAKHIVTMDAAMAHRVVIIIPELPDILRMGEYGSAKDGTANESEQFGKNFKEKLENEWAHYSPDTLPDRLLEMLESELFSDLRRRLMENAIYLAYRSPREISNIVQGRFVQGAFEDDYNVRWHEEGDQSKSRAAEHIMRFTLKFGWKKGMPPLTEVLKYMKEVSKFVKNRAMDGRKAAMSNGWDGKGSEYTYTDSKGVQRTIQNLWNGKDLLPVTPEDVVEYCKTVKKWRIVNPAKDGMKVYGWTGEDMTTGRELRAINALDTEGNEIRFPVEEKLLDQYRKGSDSPNVRKIALEIGAEQLNGKTDDPKTAQLAMKIARRLDALAVREGIKLSNSEDIQGFLYGKGDKEGQLERVLPMEREKLDHIHNARQQDIIRAMDPSLYGNDLARMEQDAIILEAEVKQAEEALRASAQGRAVDLARLNEALEMEIERIVEEHEKTVTPPKPKKSPPKAPPPPAPPPPAGGAATGGNGTPKGAKGAKASQGTQRAMLKGGWRYDPRAAVVIGLQTGKGARGPQGVSFHHMSPDAVGKMVKGQLKGHHRSSHLMVGGQLNPYALDGLRQGIKQTVWSRFSLSERQRQLKAVRARRGRVCRKRGPARGATNMIPNRR